MSFLGRQSCFPMMLKVFLSGAGSWWKASCFDRSFVLCLIVFWQKFPRDVENPCCHFFEKSVNIRGTFPRRVDHTFTIFQSWCLFPQFSFTQWVVIVRSGGRHEVAHFAVRHWELFVWIEKTSIQKVQISPGVCCTRFRTKPTDCSHFSSELLFMFVHFSNEWCRELAAMLDSQETTLAVLQSETFNKEKHNGTGRRGTCLESDCFIKPGCMVLWCAAGVYRIVWAKIFCSDLKMVWISESLFLELTSDAVVFLS